MKQKQKVRYLRIASCLIVIFMIVSIGSNIYKTFKYKYDIQSAQTENKKLKQEKEDLDNEIAKLKDKNYLQSYVSGTIFSTEKGTSVYVLPKAKDKAPD